AELTEFADGNSIKSPNSSNSQDSFGTQITQTKTRISQISENLVNSGNSVNSPNSVNSVNSALESDLAIRERSLSRIGFYAEGLAASNNWVISGKRTLNGLPILANDPHLRPGAPGIWYLTHL